MKRWGRGIVAAAVIPIGVLAPAGVARAAGGGPEVIVGIRIVYQHGSSISLAGPKDIDLIGEHLRDTRRVSLTATGVGTFALHWQVESGNGEQFLEIYVPKRIDEKFTSAPTEQLLVHWTYRKTGSTWSSTTWFDGRWLFGDWSGPGGLGGATGTTGSTGSSDSAGG